MTRTILLTLAAIGISPAVILALVSLAVNFAAVFFRPLSFSFRLYRPARSGEYLDFLPALQLSATTSLLILAGSALLLIGLARIKSEVTKERTLPPPSSVQ